jgi:hypothetical protein
MNNKSGQIGSTLSWFFAIVVIFLILLLFFIFSGAIATQRLSGFEKPTLIEGNESVKDYVGFRGFVNFLESPVLGQEDKTVLVREELELYERTNIEERFPKEILRTILNYSDCYDYLFLPYEDYGLYRIGETVGEVSSRDRSDYSSDNFGGYSGEKTISPLLRFDSPMIKFLLGGRTIKYAGEFTC